MRVYLFDIDGTLIQSGGAGSAAMLKALAVGFGIDSPQRVPMSGRTDRAIFLDLLTLHDLEPSPANLSRFVASYLSCLPDRLAACDGQVLPGITWLLAELANREDTAVGLLTGNLREGARLKLGHYGLFEHFAFGGFGDEHLDRDDVAHFALAEVRRYLSREVELDSVWVIGDTPLDVRCARAIGAKAAAVATGTHSADELAQSRPDILLDDLTDAMCLLDA